MRRKLYNEPCNVDDIIFINNGLDRRYRRIWAVPFRFSYVCVQTKIFKENDVIPIYTAMQSFARSVKCKNVLKSE